MIVVLACSGCGHVGLRHGNELSQDLSTISEEDLFNEGLAYAARGDTLRAEQYFNASRRRGYDPHTVVAWLVRICVASGRFKTALKHAAVYLRDNPSNWWLRFVVGNIHDALGDVERARAELEWVVEAQPQRSLPHYRLAVLYRERLQNRDLSSFHFQEYLRLAPHGSHAAEARSVLAAHVAADRGPQLIVRSSNSVGAIP